MGFSKKVEAEALARCGRHCCICHEFAGPYMELHHIKQAADGGEDTLDNCIPLCLKCHADMGKTDPRHPKRKRYTEDELRRHRDMWYEKVASSPAFISEADSLPVSIAKENVFKSDIALFHSICNMFTDNVCYWLSEQDLGGAHPSGVFDSLESFYHMDDNPFMEFSNAEMEKARGNLKQSVGEFLSFRAYNTFPEEKQQVTRAWLLRTGRLGLSSWSWETNEQYEQEAKQLNDLATTVWTTYREFVKQGKSVLGI